MNNPSGMSKTDMMALSGLLGSFAGPNNRVSRRSSGRADDNKPARRRRKARTRNRAARQSRARNRK